jgi:cysteine synthase
VHAISASARQKIEAAGGTVELLREPKEQKKRRHKARPAAAEEPADTAEQPAAEAEEAPADEPEAES